MIFKVDDWVVHPRHGVGQIVEIEEHQFDSRPSQPYYQISIPQGTMWVQVEASSSGLRKVATRDDFATCRDVLKSRPADLAEDFHERQKALSERLLQGSLQARCELVRDLSALSWHKPLAEGIASIARVARQVLCEEWGMVEGVSEREATREVDRLLKEGKSAYKE
jgi:CarD family transcriptional regulator